MDGAEGQLWQERNIKESDLMLNTIEILSEEKENILSEVLKCNVCLEIPSKGKQVRICEQGHHFCLTCHSKMDLCGICRGQLLETRNFVVEQLVSRLGTLLGISHDLPAGGPVCNLTPGLFKCLHNCPNKVPAYRMLTHLRSSHSTHLIDNVRSNPYTGQFSLSFDQEFLPFKKYIFSAQISDMGLFTIELNFYNLDFFGCVRMLGNKSVSSLFRHQLVVRVPNNCSGAMLEFSVTNCPVFNYLMDTESISGVGGGLKVKGADLLEHINVGDTVSIFFSVWKEQQINKSSVPSVSCLPETHFFFENDRKIRRNKNRNIRRKNKAKLKKLINTGGKPSALLDGFSRLCI